LVAEGAKVVVTGRREDPLKELVGQHPDEIRYITTDVTQKGAPAQAVGFAIEQFGRLDVIVNSAGLGTLGPLVDLDDDALAQTLAVNVQGTVATIREAIPHLAKQGGAIVNISSTLARASMPGAAVYSGAKDPVDERHWGRHIESASGTRPLLVPQ
jgi:NADP-dependent 3-hydroxy acid dehydrogenase YdfG